MSLRGLNAVAAPNGSTRGLRCPDRPPPPKSPRAVGPRWVDRPSRDPYALTELRTVVVFGGTGFLGQRVVGHLLDHNFAVRAVSRHPARTPPGLSNSRSPLESMYGDVNDDRSVVAAIDRAFAVVNAVSLYAEGGGQTFHSVHVEAAARVAQHSRQLGVQRLVHVSGIGADGAAAARYIASRGRGETAVRGEFSAAIIVRPSVMFGADDTFLNQLIDLMRALPAFPMFGRGKTRLQPSWVEDVAEAIARALDVEEPQKVYELAGPQIYLYKRLLQAIGEHLGFKPMLVPVPFGWWRALAFIAERLPHPPVTPNQVDLMELDNVASPDLPGFEALGIHPRGIESVLTVMLGRRRPDRPAARANS
jgi:uncharacterized protein YbjT (DUF2867 family)